jgi:putative PEP-CTERM system histidine kinase
MNWLTAPDFLISTNLVILGCLFIYLLTKIPRHPSIAFIALSFTPLIAFQLGSYFFNQTADSSGGAKLVILSIFLTAATFVPLSRRLGRTNDLRGHFYWSAFYAVQIILLLYITGEILSGRVVEWVTGILDQPIIIIANSRRFYFLNVLGSNVLALLYLDKTLQLARDSQKEKLKFVYIAYLGLTVYFSYLAVNIFLSSYISQSMLYSGTAILFCALVLLCYSFFRYPVWEVRIGVSRNLMFGILSATAGCAYLIISGGIIDLLRLAQPRNLNVLLPIAAFGLVACFLSYCLSAKIRTTLRRLVTKNFFRHKYDYRDLWMKFSDKSSGSLNLREVLPRVAEFIADAMVVRQVAIWLSSPTSGAFYLAYCHDLTSTNESEVSTLKIEPSHVSQDGTSLVHLPTTDVISASNQFPIDKVEQLKQLGIQHIAFVEKGTEVLALLGIGTELQGEKFSAEDEQLLTSIGNQLGNLILTHKLSEELLLAREWESFNRFASFILHDLKNLATMQSMTLENAKHLSRNPEFTADAFATFYQTTEKMINLIASLSVQRGQFSLKQQPVNILEVISHTFDDLKLNQRNGIKLRTSFPPQDKPPIVSGDPELLQKAFTNLLLNAIQSLPKGEGAVEITVSQQDRGKITTAIRDTGCGISPERLENLFRPFQTTKNKGMGIGLCHTRSIIEVHGGQIRIESEVNAGTKVEVDFPTP